MQEFPLPWWERLGEGDVYLNFVIYYKYLFAEIKNLPSKKRGRGV
jgi:hypothetical protein